ncbi:Hsp70 family protein [Nocardia terpenica]|uniref:Hsp70 family protein n=1 Tax=Nocardia terpenica TaxID=455432 RepID=UPI0018935E77|nr:Hsp70 family protein [Nocardia terpenica]MBF6065784.1 Hsp70 family protein [Nocardia terpenica]MBF6108453.1 Hsp70 family protein [Nocardia terpenica]MBF6115899.1 Hsp70 family protein [Nocardia terpenica]MBF6123029.1 Hsp70 family protein [Nocardia terpenica]MBF6156297.1 Hsp70 family protein [Nocardia terpenica]
MTVGLGVSIGTVNTVCAVASGGGGRHGHRPNRIAPSATWRTTLTFDSTGTARVGRIPRHGRAITEFADLTQRSAATARVGHRALSAADLVATVVASVAGQVLGGPPGPEVALTVTHPVGYPPDRVAELRHALAALGLGHATLVSEPVAAAAWLAAAHGPLMPGLALVYDLGGSGLTVTLVRVGAGCPVDPVVGEPLRCTDFGGRAFGAQLARRERWSAGVGPSLAHRVTDAAITELRTAHVRHSLEAVYECLRIADVTMADVDCVLVVGGAARPPEVAGLLAGALARPVIVAPDPERTIADGAALLAYRLGETALGGGARRGHSARQLRRRLARAAAVAGAVAMAGALISLVPGDHPAPVSGPPVPVMHHFGERDAGHITPR